MKVKSLLFAIVFLVFGGICFSNGAKGFADNSKESVDLNTGTAYDFSKGDRVQGDIIYALDSFCYNEETKDGKTNIVEQYYVITIGEDLSFIALKAEPQDMSLLNEHVNNTYKYLAGEIDELPVSAFSVDGIIERMPDEVYAYYADYFLESEFFEQTQEAQAALKPYILPYMITPIKYNSDYPVMLILGAVFIALGLIFLIRLAVYIKKDRAYIAPNGDRPRDKHTKHDHSEMYSDFSASGTMCDDDEKPPLGFE